MKIFTIGFAKKSAETFFSFLKKSGPKRIVDIRLNNVSQLAGFTKRDDLKFFLREICDMDYVYMPELAPTKEMLTDYRNNKIDWKELEAEFNKILKNRKVEKLIAKEIISDGCLVCSESKPQYCHRRLVAEYLKKCWGDVEIIHL